MVPWYCAVLLLAVLPVYSAQPNRPASSGTAAGNAPLSAIPLGKPEGLIHIDVAVVSRAGQAVIGLQQSDFRLLDNGRPNRIVSFAGFDLLHKADPPVTAILLLDTLGMTAAQSAVERRSVENFLRRDQGHLAQPVIIYSMNDEGFGLCASASQNGNALADAVARNQYLTRSMGSPSNMFSVSAGFPINPQYTTVPAFTGLRALGAIATDARALPGRKLLIWIGPGPGVGTGSPLMPSTQWTKRFQSVTLTMAGHANESRLLVGQEDIFQKITWYYLLLRDARITLDTLSINVDSGSAGNDLPELDWTRFISGAAAPQTAEPMDLYKSVLAVQSGGQAIAVRDAAAQNKSVLAMQSGGQVIAARIDALLHFSRYFYTLTFSPPPAQHSHEYHTIKIELRHSGLEAHTVQGYYDEPYYADAPAPGTREVTVAQLTRIVDQLRRDPGSDPVGELQRLRLTERLNDTRLESLQSSMRDNRARKALDILEVLSQFEEPPPSDTRTDPPPSVGEQRRILTRVTRYLDGAIPRLPNFSATRTALEYTETPAYSGGLTSIQAQALQVVHSTKGLVHYRDGDEVLQLRGRNSNQPGGTIRAYGTFGPILKTVREAFSVSGAFTWDLWEQGPDGRLAVFRFRVPVEQSHFMVQGCCLPEGDGAQAYMALPGYHGDLAVDPATGAIYRIDLIVDLHDFVPQNAVKMMVRYGKVTVGGTSYVVPVRSINMGRARQVETTTEWYEPENPMGVTGERVTEGRGAYLVEGFRTWGPWTTLLTEYTFDHYRISRGDVNILPGFSEVPSESSTNP